MPKGRPLRETIGPKLRAVATFKGVRHELGQCDGLKGATVALDVLVPLPATCSRLATLINSPV